jgi:hypothetical protein
MGRTGRLAMAVLLFIGALLVTELLYVAFFGKFPAQAVEIGLNGATVGAVFFLASRFNAWRARKLLAQRREYKSPSRTTFSGDVRGPAD